MLPRFPLPLPTTTVRRMQDLPLDSHLYEDRLGNRLNGIATHVNEDLVNTNFPKIFAGRELQKTSELSTATTHT